MATSHIELSFMQKGPWSGGFTTRCVAAAAAAAADTTFARSLCVRLEFPFWALNVDMYVFVLDLMARDGCVTACACLVQCS